MSSNVLIPLLPLAGAIIAGFFGRLLGVKGSQAVTSGSVLLALALSIGAFMRVAVHNGPIEHDTVMTWIVSGGFAVNFAVFVDKLTALMLIVVTTVSSIVHLYAIGYMHEDEHNPRFFAYLSFFTFAMLMLVTGDNFVQLFLGWEGVGVASYLLIGFWFKKESACNAAIKAFLVNRVGDFGFALGIFATFMVFGKMQYTEVFALVQAGQYPAAFEFLGHEWSTMTIICLLLFMGAMGKSAQLGLHTWLPDAMEGPTPVSALIHAATMVTAGVFMVCRLSPMFEQSETALAVVTIVGAATAFMAATVGLVQNDIKRVIAYSTMSQLGYMFFGAGVSAYGAAMFHLFTHAFFKALLFLGSGAVIVAMHHQQDMRYMGGLRKKLPLTYIYMMLGSLALTGLGIPGTPIGLAGFYSKDAILESAYAAHTTVGMAAFVLGILAAFMTTFYSFRLLFMTFHGEPRWHLAPAHEEEPVVVQAHGAHGHAHDDHGHGHAHDDHGHGHAHDDHGHGHAHDDHGHGHAHHGHGHDDHGHGHAHDDHGHDDHGHGGHGEHGHHLDPNEKPWYMKMMLFPLVVLAVGSVVAGAMGHNMVVGNWFGPAIYMAPGHNAMENAHHVPFLVKLLPLLMFLAGLALAWLMYIKNTALPGLIAARMQGAYRFVLNAWYFNELYDVLFIRSAKAIGKGLWQTGDATIIDGYGVNGTASLVQKLAGLFRQMQSGYVYHYAFAMMVGVLVLVTFYT